MGTSTSNSGRRAGSPFDPEWLDQGTIGGATGAVDGGGNDQGDANPDGAGGSDAADANQGPNVASDRPLMPARASLGRYLSGGGREHLRGAVRSMINKGMGGPGRASKTMRGVAHGVGRLGSFLEAVRDGANPQIADWVQRVRSQNLSVNDLILELIKEVMPDTGSTDDESLRNAGTDALSQLYENDPNVDLLQPTDEQIRLVMGYTIANEVCSRVHQQLGQAYEKLKHDPQRVQEMRNDITEWIQSEVIAIMDGLNGKNMEPQALAAAVIETALKVFAE